MTEAERKTAHAAKARKWRGDQAWLRGEAALDVPCMGADTADDKSERALQCAAEFAVGRAVRYEVI